MVTSPVRHELYGLMNWTLETNRERITRDTFINGDVVYYRSLKGEPCFALLDTEGYKNNTSIHVKDLIYEKVEGLDIYYLYKTNKRNIITKDSLTFSRGIYKVRVYKVCNI
jgi:hypothetical protein